MNSPFTLIISKILLEEHGIWIGPDNLLAG